MQTQVMKVNGIDLHVTTAGAGSPVLLLHGLTANAGFRLREIDELQRAHTVIAPDLRGHGKTTRPASYTLQDHVDDMLGLLDALGIEQTAVMGTSMGSYVAQALALQAPEVVTQLVLVVARAHGATTATARYLAEHAAEVAGMTPMEQQLWVAQRMFAPGTPQPVLEAALAWSIAEARAGASLTAEQVQAANAALTNFDFREALQTLNIPTLVISGRYDVLNPPVDGEELQRLLPHARLEIFENSGHMLPLEEPEHLGQVVRDFLAGTWEADPVRRLTFATGVTLGYVLGSRAGRPRYEQIVATSRHIADRPGVRFVAGVISARVSNVFGGRSAA